ncbi:hypothetical protein BVRB_9g216560 [Beta vulgaris subsp. vulgaris]|uniref:GATA transcription factor 7 n=1 Tax=Beta vulgaris subsp. vulgaris TaxID=3555 RepID=UPI00053F8A20|nr:GATA transcription factor 7 [Beta vulgaris subsp. vulgaris]XP_019107103.1 GATA transcription factor 7 [Beta vulgaris subsp. vulgaris]KMT00345.1 hypothetical protein BVRB_9g216560 [Beta vulgaris subsp. vulgaris]
MEARALKSSYSSELAMKSVNPQNQVESFWCVTGLPTDDFSIDDFFNLPNEEQNVDGSSSFFEEEEKDSFSLSSQDPIDDSNSNSTNFSPGLAIPVDDVQELELWSHLMDDSIPDPTLACPCPNLILDTTRSKPGFYNSFMNRVEPVSKPGLAFIPSAVPVKPRSKRSRTTTGSWVFGSSYSYHKSESSSSPVSTLLFPPPVMQFSFGKRAAGIKKPKTKPPRASSSASLNSFSIHQRSCSHCQVTKTPQWRAGPSGPKTLCNACGVRFKSGRLFPEYRPACSPTFSSEVHSNSHRKVLEMRKKKEDGSTTTPKILS